MIRISMMAVAVMCLSVSCAAHKGSSSFEMAQTNNTTTMATPKIKSNEDLKAQAEAAEAKARDAKQKVQEQARLEAQRAQEQADNAKRIAEQAAQEEAEKIRQEAESKAKEVQTSVEEKLDKVEDKTITVREESAKVIESKGTKSEGNYHIIIGTFKSLANARNVSSSAVANGFLPSIMENDEGLYRVSIYTGNESIVRKKLIEIRSKFPEYAGVWIMKIK